MNLLFLFLVTAFAFGRSPTAHPANVNHKDKPLAVVEARREMIDGHRMKAIKILTAAILKEKSVAMIKELQTERDHLAQIFLTNEGQKKYELAESSRNSGGSGFLTFYRQAMQLEPGNTRVMAGYVLGLLTAKDCGEALTIISQIQGIDPSMAELRYLKFRAELCSNPSALTAKDDTRLAQSSLSPLYINIARAQEEYLRGNMKSALRFAREAMKIDSKFPQSYYWAFKVLSKDGRGVDEAQRFLYLCRGVNAEVRRHYTYEPRLCTQTDEVEQALKTEEAKKNETD